MQAELYTDPAAFGRLRQEWDDLLPRSHFDTLFLRSSWLEAWWQVFGPSGALRLLTVRDGGRLVGIASFFVAEVLGDPAQPVPELSFERPVPRPGMVPQTTLLFVGGTEVSDYLDVIADRGCADRVYECIWQTLERELSGWAWLDLHCLPQGSPTLAAFTALARRAGLQVSVTQEDVCPTVVLPATWEGYLQLLSKKDRHELRRKMRRAEESGRMQIVQVQDEATLDAHLARFIALHAASTPDKAEFMRDPRMPRFFNAIAHRALENGWLDLTFLTLDDVPVATFFCFRYGEAFLVYNSGLDPHAWPKVAPGVVLLGERIRHAIESGCRVFDFLQGNERYKYDLGAQDRPIYRLFVRRA